MAERRNISVLGDSISTFEGFSPVFNAFYTQDYAMSTKVYSVEETWWMQVIHALDGALLVNESRMGSSVASFGHQPASALWRIEKLKRGETTPDLILIYAGLNDVAFYVSPEEFGMHYSAMLKNATERFPAATICCGTLCRGYLRNPALPLFVNLDACTPLAEYNEQIRQAVAGFGCHLVDLAAADVEYCSIDGVHPDVTGMKTLAELWLAHMKL